ncbi:[acyl-carrier-protein] S-malonyltransferase [Thermosporothrix hazakensis]|jgi:[acyl-carrier-protein] S-malonyltransferase|uniref:Malonyl CoA-acyl carrier protein transacylase n=2 Tax=Thermosporothrix TaxID=768650 RepID=A0A326TZ49_THEHA|nr:ACP S-malonyltransferase [Thermosporothrix hazakensis]PZW22840.1 [acyl-carrier-protein] S-malonyltransferase [Thermosporothrix hazakensis]BBH91665.1 malonyl CoA-acyl carrier protein transacylase [Thermosporothrix sp. COM3]GCE49807.1 malonyl CoA-acyl carrier protein transacylase [Thermosporothrix hazakensis]
MEYAFLFPGQGSQQVGMGKDLYRNYVIARETFEEANDILGFDLSRLCFTGPQVTLTATENAQPAILTMSVALQRVLTQEGIIPGIVAGHSIGSFASLVAAGCLPFADAVRIVRQRGLLMAAVQQPGSMLAVASADELKLKEVEKMARERFGLDIAANNSPAQSVFSGAVESIQALQDALADRSGVQAKRFSVSQAFHSRLMGEKKQEWEQFLNDYPLLTARIPVGLNVQGNYTTDVSEIRKDLVEQFTRTVQWRSLFQHLLDLNITQLIEVGMGHTLAGLARAWPGRITVQVTESVPHLAKLIKQAQKQQLATRAA